METTHGTRPAAATTGMLVIAAFLASCALAPAPGAGPGITAATLQRWHELKAAGGPTFSGSPAWRAHVDWVEKALGERGVVA
ncbi:MAG: hypothetical protein OEW72_03020, partial [Gammaproteobacteria bacterium]|nr:hypothetical protein [Gammaproteobacteria bacterium]